MSYFADDLSMNTNFLQELLLSVFRKTRKLVKKSSIFKIKRFGIQELSESMMTNELKEGALEAMFLPMQKE